MRFGYYAFYDFIVLQTDFKDAFSTILYVPAISFNKVISYITG